MKVKKFLSILLAVLMMFSVSSVAFAEDKISCSGSYKYIDADKKLALKIYEEIYLLDEYPWDSYRDEIEEIEIIYGDWSFWMFDHVFENMAHVKTISLIKDDWCDKNSVTYFDIPAYAFANMPELETIILRGKNKGRIDETAFEGCKNVKTVINESDLLVIPLDEECKDNVMISCYNDSAQHQACVEQGISHITIDKDKTCGHNSGNPLERIEEFFRNLIDSLRSFFEKLFGR